MSDAADKANERMENWLDGNIAKVRERTKLNPCQHCYNCNEPVTGQQLFCDTDCRDDYSEWERRSSNSF